MLVCHPFLITLPPHNSSLNDLSARVSEPPLLNRLLRFALRVQPAQKLFVLLNACIMNIFVAKLNFKTSKEVLEAAFASFDQVLCSMKGAGRKNDRGEAR